MSTTTMPNSHLHFDSQAYLARINLTPDILALHPNRSLPFLSLVVAHHRCAIPFENLATCGTFPVDPAHADTSIGERVSLDPVRLFRKLVTDRRGGWCFEQNALLATALRHFGFAVETVCGRVIAPTMDKEKGYLVKAMTHMLLLVQVDDECQTYLCDVGFGGRGEPPVPLLVSSTAPKTTTPSGETYELRLVDKIRDRSRPESFTGDFYVPEQFADVPFSTATSTDFVLRYQKDAKAPIFPIYVFSTTATMAHIDYDMANWFSSTHPSSHFTQRIVCAKRTNDEHWSLTGRELKSTRHGHTIATRTLESDAHVLDVLKTLFGLESSVAAATQPLSKASKVL
ncbi:Aste57867_15002 [Aphanomyces stellatus]|uniref:Aste57867_15002 protein n=1 Tax=Aphanomyces stellatus TaxID=120398 RepID=A0A485L3X4_9STRA|nr:hypothetical protein As57867_014946 [Aphanomyces stellatus]VFT91816.1 Aste57867_15002 [Aphanomyces stellatus]